MTGDFFRLLPLPGLLSCALMNKSDQPAFPQRPITRRNFLVLGGACHLAVDPSGEHLYAYSTADAG